MRAHTFVEYLVANIPSVNLASPLSTFFSNVVLYHTSECGGTADRGDPTRQLRVPDKVMATDDLSIGLCKCDKGITAGKVEDILTGFDGIPFHAVFRRELVELSLDNGGILSIGESASIGAGTKVLLALGFHTGTQTSSSGCRSR